MEQVSKVKPGMSRVEVTNTLGTPLVADVFHANRWDYYYSHDLATKFGPFGREREKYHVTVYFKDDKVERIEGEGAQRKSLPEAGPPQTAGYHHPGAPPDPKKRGE